MNSKIVLNPLSPRELLDIFKYLKLIYFLLLNACLRDEAPFVPILLFDMLTLEILSGRF